MTPKLFENMPKFWQGILVGTGLLVIVYLCVGALTNDGDKALTFSPPILGVILVGSTTFWAYDKFLTQTRTKYIQDFKSEFLDVYKEIKVALMVVQRPNRVEDPAINEMVRSSVLDIEEKWDSLFLMFILLPEEIISDLVTMNTTYKAALLLRDEEAAAAQVAYKEASDRVMRQLLNIK